MDEVRRFQGHRINTLLEALRTPPEYATGFAVAFSGGLDSTALLHALTQVVDVQPLRAIHVCHHLQPDAEHWADHCANACAALGLDCLRLDVQIDTAGQSMEAAARVARYAALADALAADECLVLAHHVQDQAETFLLQALRGAGVAGLAAMPVARPLGAGWAWRPWLSIDRTAIRGYAEHHDLEWIDDPSNGNDDIDRAYLRLHVWPGLTRRFPAAAQTLARSAGWAGEAAQVVTQQAIADHESTRTGDGALSLAAMEVLERPRRRGCIRAWLAANDADPPDHRHMAQIERLLAAAEHAGPRVVYADTEVRRFDSRLFVMPRLVDAGDLAMRWSGAPALGLPGMAGTLRLTLEQPVAIDLLIALRRGGERLEAADGSTRSLKEALRAARTPPWVRERMPLIFCAGTLVAVADRWIHPRVETILGCGFAAIVWDHGLVGDPRALSPAGLSASMRGRHTPQE